MMFIVLLRESCLVEMTGRYCEQKHKTRDDRRCGIDRSFLVYAPENSLRNYVKYTYYVKARRNSM